MGCSVSPSQSGYKIIRYAEPLNQTQPEFTITHGTTTIVGTCADNFGKHIGCDQLKSLVGNTIPDDEIDYPSGDDFLTYRPRNKPNIEAEIVLITKVQSPR